MPIYEIVFYLFSAVMLASAVAVITSRNPVYSALFLVLTFFSASAIWMLLEAEFLAIILIVVYVGAVMVLFLFVVMMLDINLEPLQAGFVKYMPIGIGVAVLMAIQLPARFRSGWRAAAGGHDRRRCTHAQTAHRFPPTKSLAAGTRTA